MGKKTKPASIQVPLIAPAPLTAHERQQLFRADLIAFVAEAQAKHGLTERDVVELLEGRAGMIRGEWRDRERARREELRAQTIAAEARAAHTNGVALKKP